MSDRTRRAGARRPREARQGQKQDQGRSQGHAQGAAGLERIFGRHSVRAVLLVRPKAVSRLAIMGAEGAPKDAGQAEIVALAEAAGLAPHYLDADTFQRLGGFSRDEKHQGLLALAEPRRIHTEKDFGLFERAKTVLALDQVTTPQNLATMVRSAAFFGLEAIMVLRDRSVDVSSEVVRYAVGGAEFVEIFKVTNLSQSLEALRADFGFHVVGLDERGEKTLAETDFPEKLVLVVGAEGEGLRQKTRKYCDALVRIPGGREGLESLNAGVATAVAMAEVFRNRG